MFVNESEVEGGKTGPGVVNPLQGRKYTIGVIEIKKADSLHAIDGPRPAPVGLINLRQSLGSSQVHVTSHSRGIGWKIWAQACQARTNFWHSSMSRIHATARPGRTRPRNSPPANKTLDDRPMSHILCAAQRSGI